MAVYVDRARNQLGRMRMSHMLADTLDELHAMADRVGLRREWFQNADTPHYDLCQQKRKLAIEFGAVEIGNRQVVVIIRQWRGRTNANLPAAEKSLEKCRGWQNKREPGDI